MPILMWPDRTPMPALRELQNDFAAALFTDREAWQRLCAHCAPTRREQGIAAYRRGVMANLANAVCSTYPVIESIVGKDFLYEAALGYAAKTPSQSGDLNAFGADFDRFLAIYAPTLPYLPDIARLEWLIQTVYSAEDAPPQDFSLLTATPTEAWGGLCLRLDAAHAILRSQWPVVQIWEINQVGYTGDFAVDFTRSETALVHRRFQGVVVTALGNGEEAFLQRLAAGETLAESMVAANAENAQFDLAQALQRFVANGLFRKAGATERPKTTASGATSPHAKG